MHCVRILYICKPNDETSYLKHFLRIAEKKKNYLEVVERTKPKKVSVIFVIV